MDTSSGMIIRSGNSRYLVDGQPSSSQRYIVQQDSVGMKRSMGGGYPSGGGAIIRPQTNKYMTAPNNRLISVPQSPANPASTSMALKRSFTTDYQHDFHNQAQRYARSADKSKGLRHFSTKVCEKVKEKGRTNYNEVADELVAEYFDSLSMPMADTDKQTYDMKNIRRRVYDALNVLMAMNIIEKEKKEIRWVGLPTSSVQEVRRLDEEKAKRAERIKEKTDTLYDLVMQLVAYKSLVERNRERERSEGRPADNTILYLPFVVVNTDKRTIVECNISPDKSEYVFSFDHPFEIQDDIEVLKRLGFAQGLESGEVSEEIRPKIKSCLPNSLRNYVDPIIDGAYHNRLQHFQPPRAFEHKKPIVMSNQMGGRPLIRVPRPAPSQPPTLVNVQRFMSNRQQQQPQPRYVHANVGRQSDRYYSQSAGANGSGQKQQQYMVRPIYASNSVGGQYMEEIYDDEESHQMEYEQ